MSALSRPAAGEHPAARLRARGLELDRDGSTVLSGVELDVPDGAVTAVTGPNGSGKSTLLAALARQLRPAAGVVELDGTPVYSHSPVAFARTVALLPQSPSAPDEVTVAELVGRGRYPHQRWYRRYGAEDEQIVSAALRATGTEELAERPVGRLSGGQRQRVWLAMVLAQQAPLVLLDEPTTYLDLVHALEIMLVVRGLCDDSGRTVVMVLHDLNLAARFADHLVVVADGGIVTQGPPAEVVTEGLLAEVFRLRAAVVTDPVTGGVLVVPDRPLRDRA